MKKNIYDIDVQKMNGAIVSLSGYKGKILLIVNTASKCGFTPQYKGLQSLYEKHKDKGFEILGFPCNQFLSQEPGTNDEIAQFCEINFGVTFPIFNKIDVKGKNIHPLYKFLTGEKRGSFFSKNIKWNFTKFLIDRNGNVIKRFAPYFPPEKIEPFIADLLGV
jgi:glutathione peroxidase